MYVGMFILAIVVIALVAGYIANYIVGKGKGFLPWEMFVAGLVGSFVGGMLANLIVDGTLDIRPSGFIGSIVGAIIVLGVWGWLRSGPLKGRI